jgi:flagellar biosynthetic protein FlhB
MAEDDDKSQKTEEPTQKRLDDARKKGQVPVSRELNNALMLSAAAAFVGLFSPAMMRDLGHALRPFIETPHLFALAPGDLQWLLFLVAKELGLALLLPALLFLTAALASSLMQNGFLISASSLQPKLERLSPIAGAKRLFALKSLVEFLKGIFKISLIGAAAVLLLWPETSAIITSAETEISVLMVFLQDLTLRLLFGVAVLTVLVAILDLLYQRFEHRKELRMSRKDLQDEFKQTEGDPHLKARLKSLRIERGRQRMMAAVPEATVVITNPTHFAVALLYDAESMAAPKAVAKGADNIALRIRSLAEESGVPVVENPPLARTLFAAVELDQEIPAEHYRAVAEVIGYVMGLQKRRR